MFLLFFFRINLPTEEIQEGAKEMKKKKFRNELGGNSAVVLRMLSKE